MDNARKAANSQGAGEVSVDNVQSDEANGICTKSNKNSKGSSTTNSLHPSTSSYSTAEEDLPDRTPTTNGLNNVSDALSFEKNPSVDELCERIRNLEDVLAGKEAALLAVTQELDAVREMSCIDASIGPLPSGFDLDMKASIAEYNRKLQEHSFAICQRDEMIKKLAESLKQSVRDREELKKEAGRLTEQVHTLQTQLHSVGQQVQQPQTKLIEALKEKEAQLQKKAAELSQCKSQSSKEVQFLMSSLEELQQRTARSASASPKSNDESEVKLLKDLRELRLRYESDTKRFSEQLAEAQKAESLLKSQLSAAQMECEKLSLSISTLKLTYETQLSVCRDQHQGANNSGEYFVDQNQMVTEQQTFKEKYLSSQQKLQEEVVRATELQNEIKLLRLQLSDKNMALTKQNDKIQLLQSQAQEYATDIATCHQTLEQYKKRIDELQMKHSEDIVQKETNHHAEIMHLNQRIAELQENNTRQLNSMHQDLNRMKQRQMEELAMLQLSHENEVNTSKRDAERYRTELREKNSLVALQEDQLEEERQWSRTYSQQVQELGKKLNEEEGKNEEYRGRIALLQQQLQDIDQACTLYQPQIEFLHQQLRDERQKSTNILQQLEDVRKQLLLEQEKCLASCRNLDVANSDITDLKRENSELKAQVSKLDQSYQQKIKAERQRCASLQSDVTTMKEKLMNEQTLTKSLNDEIGNLNKQIETSVIQKKSSKGVQVLLESEKDSVASLKSEIEALNRQVKDQSQEKEIRINKHKEEVEELRNNLRKTEQFYLEQSQKLEQQISDLTSRERVECEKAHLETEVCNDWSTSEDKVKAQEDLCKQYLATVKSLEFKVRVLSDANINLKKEREESENELKRIKELYSISKDQFETTTSSLREELSKRDKYILELRKQNDEMLVHKNEIDAYNRQVKELITAKASLNEELSLLKKTYNEEIETLKREVIHLQDKLQMCHQTVGQESIEFLVKKCRDDIEFLRSTYVSSSVSPQVLNVAELNNSMSASGEDQEHKYTNSIPGLLSLDKLLDLCEKLSKSPPEEKEVTSALSHQVFELSYTVEKLQLELKKSQDEHHTLELEHKNLLSQLDTLRRDSGKPFDVNVTQQNMPVREERPISHISLSDLKDTLAVSALPKISKVSNIVAHWIKQHEDLEKSNLQLRITVSELQAKLTELSSNMPSAASPLERLKAEVKDGGCTCEIKFHKERNAFKNSIEILHKELVDKELHCEERIRSILKKNKNCNQSDVNCDSISNLINDLSSKAKQSILLKNELKKIQLECQIVSSENKGLVEQLEQTNTLLTETCKECTSLDADLHNSLKENSILRARLMRLETMYESVKQKTMAPDNLAWQLIEELSSAELMSSNHVQDEKCKSLIVQKIDPVKKIISKMNSDCETLLVKLQSDKDETVIYSYLQSEALCLRRLQSALVEFEQTIESKSGPASQLQVDLLRQNLNEKQQAYQDMCEAHFSLEAEMREMEERFQQQEEHLQEELRKHKADLQLWKLRAQGALAQISSYKINKNNDDEYILHCIEQFGKVYSQAFSAWRAELERVASLRENKVRLEMHDKLLAAEKKCKQQFEELGSHIQADSNVRALQVLHQQEIDTVRAECEYARIKTLNKMQEEMSSFLNQPPEVNPNLTFSEISLLFMKHHIFSQFNEALRKMSLTVRNELADTLSSLDEELKNVGPSQNSEFDVAIPDLKDLSFLEHVISKVNVVGEKLLEMQTTGLKSILSVCELNHKVLIEKAEELVKEFDVICVEQNLQQQLLKTKEEYRVATESMSATHKAEVSRLRLLLSQQKVFETSEPNETAMSVLRRELEEKHKRQMEELRTYFEQKCADFEKHYSEEVFSQHSRKLSDCSSASESELVSEMYYAGPGTSSSSALGMPSHFCDLSGESSFKDLEEHTRSVDLEKLFVANKEQLETLRLALESRHQGELEAQKEIFESRVEELLRNMTESHTAELKIQSNLLQEVKDTENLLKKKLLEAQEKITSLEQQILSLTESSQNQAEKEQKCDRNSRKESTLSALEAEVQRLSEALRCRDSESSAQIASLKIKLRQNQEDLTKLEKDLANFRSKYDTDTNSLTCTIQEKVKQIEELNLKIVDLTSCLEESNSKKKEVEIECNKLKEDFENILKKKDDFKSKLKEMHSELTSEKHIKHLEEEKNLQEIINRSVEEKKVLLDAEYAEYLEFVKKCADDTKMQLVQQHDNELKKVTDRYETELSDLRNSLNNSSHIKVTHLEEEENSSSLLDTLSDVSCIKESCLQNCLQELIKLSGKLDHIHQEQFEKLIVKLCKEEVQHHQKLHQDLEMRLESVQKESERRFHLQLEEARGDIVQALEQQIQQLLDDDTHVDERPLELQRLEKKFTSKYEEKLSTVQREYEAKISELSTRYAAQLSSARSQNRKRNITETTSEELEKLVKERDCLRNVAATLRDVVAELVRYFMSWEDDFNNTLMDELVKLEGGRDNDILSVTNQEDSIVLDQSVAQRDSTSSEDEIPVIVATPARRRHLSTSLKRVHFAPDISGILSLIDDGSLLESAGLNCSIRDASLNFQEELDRCLARLRSDSAALYALSKPALPSASAEHQTVPSSKENDHSQLSAKLTNALQTAAQLKIENEDLRNQLNILCEEHQKSYAELQATRQRLDSLEQEARQQAEVVAEGYGEGEQSMNCEVPNSPRANTVEELQNKARSLLLGTSSSEEISGVMSPTSSQHLPHIVEELCRDWEHLAEESRHKQDDLQQQVEAADKQLRATRTFMDEQAAEREQERDEYVQEIRRLQELIRDKDRDRNSHQQMNHEVEALETQLKECQSVLHETQEKLEKLNAEHKQAVEKIWTLRDIISDLEVQVATKAEEAASASTQNDALRQMLEQQGRTQLELAQEMEQLQLCSGNVRLTDKVAQLEEKLRKYQVLAEQLGDPSFIEQMKIQLRDLNASVELHTRELECAYVNSTLPPSPCLSSPSEDVSVRETIEAIRAATENKDNDSCLVLPSNEVSQVMEQWQRHARADDAVLKKLRELDLQLDDLQAEKNSLVTRLQEQMNLSSSLQAKLDDYRRKADVKHTQATAEMQNHIEDLRNEIHSYVETLETREKQIENLRSSLQQAENELNRRDAEIKKTAEVERTLAAQLQCQVTKLSAEKDNLQALLAEKDEMHVSLPALVESMLLDKNSDIDRLEKQVQNLTKQMELSSHYVVTPSTTLEFEYCESEKVRAHVALSPVMELRRSLTLPIIDDSSHGKSIGRPMEPSLSYMAEQMSIENNGHEAGQETDMSLKPVPLDETSNQSQQSTSNGSASDTLSASSGNFDSSSLASCERKVAHLEQELERKNEELESYLKQINENNAIISEMEQKCRHLKECEAELQTLRAESHNSDLEENLKKLCMDKDLEINNLKKELDMAHAELMKLQPSQQFDQDSEELKDKESEIQRLRNEVYATQAILANLQRKVQEAKQIARSPSRASPENNQALRIVHNELEEAKLEIVELKDLCRSIRSEMESEYQQKQLHFEMMLNREQEAKKSLLETLDKLQQESKVKEVSTIEDQLKDAEDNVLKKDKENQKLQAELNQLNMECVTLKQQLSTPIREATSLASKLDAEKKFADALKEELLSFKNRAASLDEECKSLKKQLCDLQTDTSEKQRLNESEELLKEIPELRTTVESLMKDQSNSKKRIKKLTHEKTILKEENIEVCKELSDMKQIIIEMQGMKASRDEAQNALQTKINEVKEMEQQKNAVCEKLSSLRRALNNIFSNMPDFSGLAEEDRHTLNRLRTQINPSNLKGAGDGPWNKLSVTETDVLEIRPDSVPLQESLEDLSGLVRHELNVSVQLDQSLLQTIDPCTRKKPTFPSSQESKAHGKSQLDLPECIENRNDGQTPWPGDKSAQEKIRELEIALTHMKDSVQLLHTQLEAERVQYYTLQQQDCDLIKEMRLKLSEALDGQAALRAQLQTEYKRRLSLSDPKDVHNSGQSTKSAINVPNTESNENILQQLHDASSEILKLRAERDAAEKQLRRLQEVEIQRSRRRAVTEEKHRRRIDQLQALQAETQQECLRLRQEVLSVNQKLQLAHEEFAKDRDTQLKNHAPFVERLKNMNTFLEEHIEENMRMAKQMEELTEEHRKLRLHIAQLEGQLAEKRSNESFEAANIRFSAERAEWEAEQKLLHLALNEATQKHMHCSDSDVEERVSHLFGRYLRTQSYRKALIWQKRYLLSVIMGMNESKSLTTSHLAGFTRNFKESKHNPRQKFRSIVMVVIAIHRMQFMVGKWHRGKRIGCGVVVQQTVSQFAFSTSSIPQGTLYTSSHVPMTREDLRSGLSQSPPTLERPRQPRTLPSAGSQFHRLSRNSRGVESLNSLSECVSNFNLVQQRFDALLSNPPK